MSLEPIARPQAGDEWHAVLSDFSVLLRFLPNDRLSLTVVGGSDDEFHDEIAYRANEPNLGKLRLSWIETNGNSVVHEIDRKSLVTHVKITKANGQVERIDGSILTARPDDAP